MKAAFELKRWFDPMSGHRPFKELTNGFSEERKARVASRVSELRRETVPLTRSFRETVQARAHRDVEFQRKLLCEAVQALLNGELDEGRSALCSCINATIGFEKLGAALGRSPKNLMRMFGPSGNPTAGNLFAVIGVLQAKKGVRLEVRAVADAA